jgi:hypothetical protein
MGCQGVVETPHLNYERYICTCMSGRLDVELMMGPMKIIVVRVCGGGWGILGGGGGWRR